MQQHHAAICLQRYDLLITIIIIYLLIFCAPHIYVSSAISCDAFEQI